MMSAHVESCQIPLPAYHTGSNGADSCPRNSEVQTSRVIIASIAIGVAMAAVVSFVNAPVQGSSLYVAQTQSVSAPTLVVARPVPTQGTANRVAWSNSAPIPSTRDQRVLYAEQPYGATYEEALNARGPSTPLLLGLPMLVLAAVAAAVRMSTKASKDNTYLLPTAGHPAFPAVAASGPSSQQTAALPPAGLHPYSKQVNMSNLGMQTSTSTGAFRSTSQTAHNVLASLKPYVSEKFEDRAIKAVGRAEKAANSCGMDVVDTDMLLVGIMAEKDCMACQCLKDAGLNLTVARKQIEQISSQGRSGGVFKSFLGRKPFSEHMKNLLERVDDEAYRTKCDYVGTEHLLLAMLREEGCTGIKILNAMNIDPAALERSVLVKIKMDKAEAQEESLRIEEAKTTKKKGPKENNLRNGRGAGDDQSHLSLKDFSTNISELARQGKLDPLIGRYKEVDRVTQILGRRRKNNAVLVGEPGVGKTAIAEGIALRIVNGEVPNTLSKKQIIELDMGMLVAGTKYRGEFEERLGNILREVEEDPNIVLVIDEIHTLVGAGGMEGGADAANLLKPAMARGSLQLIGATTLEEYRKYIEKDAALERRFQPVDVPEPSAEECVEILKGLKGRYEQHHGCEYTDDAIEAAVYMAKRYVADRFLPDKAIDVLDEAGARLRLRHDTPDLSDEGHALSKELKKVVKKKDTASKAQDFKTAQGLYEREAELTAMIELEKQKNKELSEAAQWAGLISATPIVTESDVAQVIANVSGVPVDKVSASETSSLMNLEEEMKEMMVGQEDAVQVISQSIRRARTGMRDPSRPIGSFIFAGPTGVGKSQLAKALCTSYFGSEDNMVRLDMSEYMEKHTVSKLIGSPPGYVGYDEGGGLTEKVRRSPYTLVLFDEVEKAHKDVFNLMLQILDDGRLTDAKGRTVDFKNTMVIMTTNIGSQVIMDLSKKEEEENPDYLEEEGVNEESYAAMKSGVDDELKKFFRPEFLNRLDGIVVFHKLTKQNVREIAEIFLKKTYARMKEKDVALEITPAFKERLVEMGYNPTYGARPLRRAMSTMIEDQLAEVVLRGVMKEGDAITMDMLGHDKIIVYNQDGELLYTKDISKGNFGIS